MSHDNWIEKRKGKISASNAAAILGLKPFGKTPMDAWLDIKGLKTKDVDTRAKRQGRHIESALANMYADDTGCKLVVVDEPIIHPSLPWLCGTPDRLVEGGQKGVEIKNVGKFMAHGFGDPGTDAIPDYYLVQVSIYMAITAYPIFDVYASIAGEYPEVYPVERDMELENTILENLDEWYKTYIVGNKEPEIDSSRSCADYLAAKYPRNFQPIKQADEGTERLLSSLAEIKYHLESYEEQEEAVKNLLKNYIGEADGVQGQAWKCTWKVTKDTKIINWEGIAKMLLSNDAVREIMLSSHGMTERYIKDCFTTIQPGARRFLFTKSK